jgi:hypothetical protein
MVGAISGGIAAILTTPADVLKTRTMTGAVPAGMSVRSLTPAPPANRPNLSHTHCRHVGAFTHTCASSQSTQPLTHTLSVVNR